MQKRKPLSKQEIENEAQKRSADILFGRRFIAVMENSIEGQEENEELLSESHIWLRGVYK